MRTEFLGVLMGLFISSSTITSAQNGAVLKFDTNLHDFGSIHEENGKVVTKFNFTNIGTDTLKISSADPSCSCTHADWTRNPVAPGQSGYVSADFDPRHRAGQFEKYVTVNSNATEPAYKLNIKGIVIPKVKTFNDSFPEKKGNLYFGAKQFNMKNTKIDEVKTDSMEVYNAATKPMKLSFAHLPSYVTAKAIPETVPPSSRGKIYATYDGAKKNEYGILSDTVSLVTDDDLVPTKKVFISASVIDDFSKLTPEEKANAPKISFTKEVLEYGTVKEGELVKVTFEFKNNGKTPLIIRKVAPGQEGCKIILPKTTFQNDESGTITIEFNTEGKNGVDIRRTILVTSNDPDKSFSILIIKGSVTPK